MKLWDAMDEILQIQKDRCEKIELLDLETIPKEKDTPLEVGRWYRVRNVVSLYIDLKGSTRLSLKLDPRTLPRIYQSFSGSLIRFFRHPCFAAEFVDIKGDGGFALWKGRFACAKAVMTAVTFKTYVERKLEPYIRKRFADEEIKARIGIARGHVLVKRIGLRSTPDEKRSWAVWSGTPVNWSSKLSARSENNRIVAQDNVYQDLQAPQQIRDHLVMSCECSGFGKRNLWSETSDFAAEDKDRIWELESKWCDTCGEDYINAALSFISDQESPA